MTHLKEEMCTRPPPDFACLANTSMRYDPIKKQWECIPLSPPPTRCGDGSPNMMNPEEMYSKMRFRISL